MPIGSVWVRLYALSFLAADQPVRIHRKYFRDLFDVFGRWFRSPRLPVTASCPGDAQTLGEVGLRQLSCLTGLSDTLLQGGHAPKVSFGFVVVV